MAEGVAEQQAEEDIPYSHRAIASDVRVWERCHVGAVLEDVETGFSGSRTSSAGGTRAVWFHPGQAGAVHAKHLEAGMLQVAPSGSS